MLSSKKGSTKTLVVPSGNTVNKTSRSSTSKSLPKKKQSISGSTTSLGKKSKDLKQVQQQSDDQIAMKLKSSRQNSKGSFLKLNNSSSEVDLSQRKKAPTMIHPATTRYGNNNLEIVVADKQQVSTPKSVLSRRNGDKSPGNTTNPALNRSRKSDAALETFPVSTRSSRKPSFSDANKISAKKNTTRQPSKQLETKEESTKKSQRRVLPKNILSNNNNNTDNNFDGQNSSINRCSSSSSSDNEFDVILSPRVLKRIQEQNQAAYDATNLSKESEFILSQKIDDWKRDRLEKEFKCLFYKTREISELLLEQQRKTSEMLKQTDQQEQSADVFKQKYKQCKQILKETKESIKEKEEQANNAVKKCETLSSELFDMQLKVKDQKQELKSMESEVSRVTKESAQEKNQFLDKMKELKAKLNEEKKEESKKIDSATRLETETRNKIEILEQQRDQLKEQKRQREQEVNQLRQELQDVREKAAGQIKEMEVKDQNQFHILSELEAERDKMAVQIEQLLQTNTNCQLEVSEMQRSLKEEKEEYWRMKEECSVLGLKNAGATEQLEEAKRKVESQKRKISDLEEQLIRLKADKQEQVLNTELHNQQALGQQSQLNQVKAELLKVQSQQSISAEELNKYRELSSGLERENRLLKEELSNKSSECERLRDNGQNLEQQLRREIEEIKAQNRDNEAKLKRKESKLNRLRDDTDSKVKKLMEKNLQLENELLLQTRAAEEKAQNLLELQRAQDRQALQNKMVEEERQRVELMMKSLELESKGKVEQENAMKSRIADLEKQINEIDSEKESFKNKLIFTKYETRKIKDEFNEKENKLRSTYENQIEQVQSEKEQIVNALRVDQEKKKIKDNKIKVISDIKDLVRYHKEKIKEVSGN